MSGTIVIPKKQLESLRADNSDFLWPEGAFRGLFESFEVKPLPSRNDGTPFAGYASTDGERLSAQIGSITSLDNNADAEAAIGKRKWFLDLALKDGDFSLDNLTGIPAGAWQLERSLRTIGNLAVALGAITELENGDGAIQDGFIDALRDGAYLNKPIGFIVYHKTNKKGTYAEIETFLFAS